MGRHLRLAILVLLGIGFTTGCRKAEPTSSFRSDFRVNFNYTLTSLDRTLVSSEMLWNNFSFGLESSSSTGMQSTGVIPGVKAGVNTFAIRIASQTVSPARYSITGVITATRDDGAVQTFPVSMVDVSLSTGLPATLVLDIKP